VAWRGLEGMVLEVDGEAVGTLADHQFVREMRMRMMADARAMAVATVVVLVGLVIGRLEDAVVAAIEAAEAGEGNWY